MNPTRDPRFQELDRLIAAGEGDRKPRDRKPQAIETSMTRRQQWLEKNARQMRARAAENAKTKSPAVLSFGVPYPVTKLMREASDKFLIPYELIRYPHWGRSFNGVANARRYVALALRKKGLSTPLIAFYLGMSSGGVYHLLYGPKPSRY